MNTFEILSLFKMVVSPCEKMQLLRESYSQIYSYTLRQQPMVKLFQDVVTIRLRSFFISTPRPLSRGLLSTDLRLSTMMRCCSMRSGRLIKRVRILFFDRKFNYSTFNDINMIMMQSSSIIWFKRCLKRSIFLFSCHLFNYASLVAYRFEIRRS